MLKRKQFPSTLIRISPLLHLTTLLNTLSLFISQSFTFVLQSTSLHCLGIISQPVISKSLPTNSKYKTALVCLLHCNNSITSHHLCTFINTNSIHKFYIPFELTVHSFLTFLLFLYLLLAPALYFLLPTILVLYFVYLYNYLLNIIYLMKKRILVISVKATKSISITYCIVHIFYFYF